MVRTRFPSRRDPCSTGESAVNGAQDAWHRKARSPAQGLRRSMASTIEEPPVDGAGDCAIRPTGRAYLSHGLRRNSGRGARSHERADEGGGRVPESWDFSTIARHRRREGPWAIPTLQTRQWFPFSRRQRSYSNSSLGKGRITSGLTRGGPLKRRMPSSRSSNQS
jgi:hypothetical protein